MKILHLFSDWKWTGPAAPVLNMCAQLQQRGHQVIYACQRQAWEKSRSIATFIPECGIKATQEFQLDHHAVFTTSPGDVRRLMRFLQEHQIDVVNTHLSHDHLLGGLAARLASRRVAVIRTDHYRDSFAPGFLNKLLLTRLTDGVLTFSGKARETLTKHFGLSPERIARINPALAETALAPFAGEVLLRRELGFGDEDVVLGVVARFQKYRKMDMFFEALAKAIKRAPNLRAMLVGRSSQFQETILDPIRHNGLEQHAKTAGYLTDRYREGLASMDAFVFMIAGSDGTGRAMLEAMAMGKPVIANNIGMLAELNEAGRTGLIFNDNADDLADCMVQLAADKALRRKLGEGAAQKAHKEFALDKQAAAIEAFYEQIVSTVRSRS